MLESLWGQPHCGLSVHPLVWHALHGKSALPEGSLALCSMPRLPHPLVHVLCVFVLNPHASHTVCYFKTCCCWQECR